MQLIAVFIEKHRNVRDQLFNFSNDFEVKIDEENGKKCFSIIRCNQEEKKANHLIDDYSLRIIIGKNGTGKSSIVECLRNPNLACISFYHEFLNSSAGAASGAGDGLGKGTGFGAGAGALHKDLYPNLDSFSYYVGNVEKKDTYNIKKDYNQREISLLEKRSLIKCMTYEQTSRSANMTVVNALRNLYAEYSNFEIMDDHNLKFDKFTIIPKEFSFSSGNTETNLMLKKTLHDSEDFPKDERDARAIYFASFFLSYKYSKEAKKCNDILRSVETYYDLEKAHMAICKIVPHLQSFEHMSINSIVANLSDFLKRLKFNPTVYWPDIKGLKIAFDFDKNPASKKTACERFGEDVKKIRDFEIYIDTYFTTNYTQNIPKWLFNHLFYIDFFKYAENNEPIFFGSLSDGEKEVITLFAEIFRQIKAKSTNSFIVLVDEPANSFHPEWQRRFINCLNNFITKLPKEYIHVYGKSGEKRIQNVIITTHSPFIISDVTKNDVIFLTTCPKTKRCKIAGKEEGHRIKLQTFGSNINHVLMQPFFMDGTMGEFAKNKIKNAADYFSNISNSISADESLRILHCMDEDNFIRKLIEDIRENNVKTKNVDGSNEEI